MLLGGTLSLRIGPAVLPIPAPPPLLESLESVTVTNNDTGRSGFQLTLAVGRNQLSGLLDYPPLLLQMVRPGFRVIVSVTVGAKLEVLMDGVITNHQLAPSAQPGGSKLTVTGEDLTALMDLKDGPKSFPAQLNNFGIAGLILKDYVQYGIKPVTVPLPGDVPPLPAPPPGAVVTKMGTHFKILNDLLGPAGVFQLKPGDLPGVSTAYWGPAVRVGLPQRAMTFNMGSSSNVNSISFQSDATKPKLVEGKVKDAVFGMELPVFGLPLDPPLAALPAWINNQPFVGTRWQEDDQKGSWGLAMQTAFAESAKSQRDAVTASGELDVGRYGDVLKARAPVDVRGVGLTFDGTWYVKSVTHNISRGSYKQSFSLERDGVFPISPVVRP
jgi:hypothetical protein